MVIIKKKTNRFVMTLDAIFAQYDIVLPSAKEEVNQCFGRAVETIKYGSQTGFILYDNLDDFEKGRALALKKNRSPFVALDKAIIHCKEASLQSSLIHYLALKYFFFSEKEKNARFDEIFEANGSHPMIIGPYNENLPIFYKKSWEIDYRIAILAKHIPFRELKGFVDKLQDRKISVSNICRSIPLDAPSYIPNDRFVAVQDELTEHNQSNTVLICSPGRSGSTLLTFAIEEFCPELNVIKSHILPPNLGFKGKILFIFGNPDLSAESALHLTLEYEMFGLYHFIHLESADREWLKRLGGTTNQNEYENLLSYDALGCKKQLQEWLHTKTIPCKREEAQILAIKYENLWECVDEIGLFLGYPIDLPPKKSRGYKVEELSSLEFAIREKYNLGTKNNPSYAAYDEARALWEKAPAFQYLKKSNPDY